MGFYKEFLIGFTKPLRDLVGSIVTYSLITVSKTIPSTVQSQNNSFPFNIWLFLTFFIGISVFDDLMSEMISHMRKGYRASIDAFVQMMGLIIGTFLLSVILIPVYTMIGGNVSDVITSEFIASICLIAGMAIRLHYSSRR